MSQEERTTRQEEERIKQAAREVLPKLGHNNCVVICPNLPVISYDNDGKIPQWAIRATDDQKQTARIDIAIDPAETDGQIQKKIKEAFATITWKPA